jgi:PAS domain S-box-containing protein
MKSRRKWFVEPLAFKVFLFVAVLVVGVLIPAGYFLARQSYNAALNLKRSETYLQGHVIAVALEDHMLEDRRDLIRKMIEGVSNDAAVKRLMVVDHDGRVRMTNDRRFMDRVFPRDSPTCQVCHAIPARERATSTVIEIEGGTVLRSVYPFRNRQPCHRCHGNVNTVNGVLITDTNIADLRRTLKAQILNTTGIIALVALVLLVGITLMVRVLVLRRLRRIESTARAIAAGDFGTRVQVSGTDAVARLGREFNLMAGSVADLLSQLRRQRTQLENVMSSVDDGMLVVDRTFTVVAVNKSLAERIGDTRENLLFRRCYDIWPLPCDCARGGRDEHCAAMACFSTGQLHKGFRTRQAADGTIREEEVFASPILDANGGVEQVVEVWRDITERKSHEARMAEFQRLVSLGMLASGFSHEVNTPLGTMLVHVDEIRRRADAWEDELGIIRGEILRCRDLTQQFLQLSRGQSVQRELLALPEVVRSTIPLVAHVASEAGVSLRVVENGCRPTVSANGGAVRQVLLNVLLNAVQASRRGSEVRVHVADAPVPRVSVEDDGIGMAPEVREKVFEPFFTRRPSGTGLGLFVSLNLARQWGGDIHVSSVPERGSTFEILFPAGEEPCLTAAC